MPAERFTRRLNEQIGHELPLTTSTCPAPSHYDALTMPQMAALLLRPGARGACPRADDGAVPARHRRPRADPRGRGARASFDGVVAPVELALAQERRVAEQIDELLRIAREESDFASEQFMQWFIKEQVEEVATMSDLLAVVRRNTDDVENIEEYVAREQGGRRVRLVARRASPAAERYQPRVPAPPLNGPTTPARDPAAVEAALLRDDDLAVDGAGVHRGRHHRDVVDEHLEARRGPG